MASNWTVCGVCDSLEITKPSVVWCSECDEGLCTECDKHHAVSKASRTHSTIPITEYKKLPTDILKIEHSCSKHNERFQTFCRKHNCPCCRRCVIETHNNCKDIAAIDDIVKDVKSSNAINDIEQMLAEMAENLEKITKDRKDNLTHLKDQRRRIETEIKQTRLNINSHLDQIQESLMTELHTTAQEEARKIQEFLTSIEKVQVETNEHITTLSNIKQHASELQTFLAITQIENDVVNREKRFEALTNSESLKQIVLSLKYDEAFQTISKLKYIGQIDVKIKPSAVVMNKRKEKQAQLEVVSKSPILIEDIKLNLKKDIQTELSQTRGCLILPDGRLAFSCRTTNLIRFFKSDGSKAFEISLKPCSVIDITYIAEDDTIAATSGEVGTRIINIIDLKNRKVCRRISVDSAYYGIVYNDYKLISCAKFNGLHILQNGNGDVICEFKINKLSYFSYVAAFNRKLYYTLCDQSTVACCDIKGIQLWTLKDNNLLKRPRGITVDSDGNIYVACYESSKVVVISPDGKQCLDLLSDKDGLRSPWALDYNRSTNQLLVANERKTALLFQIVNNKIETNFRLLTTK